jgi:hypothetical protein
MLTSTELIKLIKYILTDYDSITKDEYLSLITTYFGIYEYDKPPTKEKALKRIKTIIDTSHMHLPLSERPLFIF